MKIAAMIKVHVMNILIQDQIQELQELTQNKKSKGNLWVTVIEMIIRCPLCMY